MTIHMDISLDQTPTPEAPENRSGVILGALTGLPNEGLATGKDFARLARKERVEHARKQIKIQIEALFQRELEIANREYNQFASHHEGYAVLLEEFEETKEALAYTEMQFDYLWRLIRSDRSTGSQIREVKKAVRDLIEEAIQFGAMLDKLDHVGRKGINGTEE